MAVIGTSNVDVSTIGNTLNSAGGSVTVNSPITYFTTNAKINRWSKKKPVSYSQEAPLIDSQFKLVNYGLDMTYIGTKTPQTVLSDASKGIDFYPYKLPTGGSNSPYRLSDFAGYNPNAVAPYTLSVSTDISVLQFPATIPFTIKLNNSEFKLTDMASFEDVFNGGYFAILYSTSLANNAQVLMYKPANPTQYQNMLYGEIPVSKAGTYYMVAVYAKQYAQNGITDVSSWADNYMPIPNGYAQVTVRQTVVYAYATLSNFANYLYYERSDASIQGFNNIFTISISKPQSVVSSSYRLGLYVNVIADGTTYETEWWYTQEEIDVTGGTSSQTITFVEFPTWITLDTLFGWWDTYRNVQSITIYAQLTRVSGQGFLTFQNTPVYNVSVY